MDFKLNIYVGNGMEVEKSNLFDYYVEYVQMNVTRYCSTLRVQCIVDVRSNTESASEKPNKNDKIIINETIVTTAVKRRAVEHLPFSLKGGKKWILCCVSQPISVNSIE